MGLKCNKCLYKHEPITRNPCASCKHLGDVGVKDNYTPSLKLVKDEAKRDKLLEDLERKGF